MESKKRERLLQVNVGLPLSFVNSIDDVRGNTPVAEFIRNFLLKNKEQLLKVV